MVTIEHQLACRAHKRLHFEHIPRPVAFFGAREAGATTLQLLFYHPQLLCNYLQTTWKSPKLLQNPGIPKIPGFQEIPDSPEFCAGSVWCRRENLSLFGILQMRSRFSRDHSSSRRSNTLTAVGCGVTEVLHGAQIR